MVKVRYDESRAASRETEASRSSLPLAESATVPCTRPLAGGAGCWARAAVPQPRQPHKKKRRNKEKRIGAAGYAAAALRAEQGNRPVLARGCQSHAARSHGPASDPALGKTAPLAGQR
ncbi:hypothetical protein GCM10027048_05560 [Hymenobacter coalescens]